MFDLTGGELFLACFIIAAVVSWSWWPRLGEAIAALFIRPDNDRPDPPSRGKRNADE